MSLPYLQLKMQVTRKVNKKLVFLECNKTHIWLEEYLQERNLNQRKFKRMEIKLMIKIHTQRSRIIKTTLNKINKEVIFG